ncbi:MAG: FAD-binding oxidoreductase [Bacteroidetes bacterium]|nr:MAG: FAD-binding oxidoreductase [Bacteroidota bacterium]
MEIDKMDLRSVYPYWLLEKGIQKSYPSLNKNIKADIVIVGAGISGALAAWYLRNEAFKIIMIDKRHVGMGSTAATTGLLQYEIDTPFIDLNEKVGARNAARSYALCNEAVFELERICSHFPAAEFDRKPSFQFASYKKDSKPLLLEFAARKKLGIDVKWLDKSDIKNKFGFDKPGGILSTNAADINAYGLTHALLHYCTGKNLEVYDHTNIDSIHRSKINFKLVTESGYKIHSRYVIIACGYESSHYISKKVNELHSTYAIISEPFGSKELWYKNTLIWETANPYLYIRNTRDNRILVGGKDDDFSSGTRRDWALNRKAKMLEVSIKKLFPHLEFITDFKWAGLFASTKDGLPYIGSLDGRSNMLFALGFGGNGIVFGVIAGRLIRDLITCKKNPDSKIFAFDR